MTCTYAAVVSVRPTANQNINFPQLYKVSIGLLAHS